MEEDLELSARGPEQLGEAIKRFRKLKDLTQEELGERANLEQKTISRVENGKPHMEIASLFSVCAALDLEIVIKPRGSKRKAIKMTDLFK